jgi:hypothetical protein
MSNSIAARIAREWVDLLGRAGLTRFKPYATLVNLFVIVAFGVGVPWRRGFDFFDPVLILLYSLVALLFAAPAITDQIGEESSGPPRMMARIAASALFGWSVFLVIVFLGILTVNIEFRVGRILAPRASVIFAALALSFAASLCVASMGALFAVVLTPMSAKLILRSGFVGLLLFLLFGARFLPPSWQAQIAANLTPRTLVRSAYVAAAILVLFAAGPIAALRKVRR